MGTELYVVIALAGFFLGGVPAGVIVSRRRFGIDVREIGSGNIGATNVTRAFGWSAGTAVFLLDFSKGLLPIFTLNRLLPGDRWIEAVAGVSLVLGHCYSPYLKFNGGKGVATSLGVVSSILPVAAGVAAISYVVFLSLTRISAVGSLAGLLALLVSLTLTSPDLPQTVLVVAISFIVIVRHRANITRLISTVKERIEKSNLRLMVLLFVLSHSLMGTFLIDTNEAFLRAKHEHKPILISFYGIWCPPCNELEESVFESSAFLRASKNFILLKIDADAPTSWSIKDRFRVGGYPTVIFVSESGREIYRIVGYRPPREFLRTMSWVYDNRKSDLDHACRSSNLEFQWRCGYACSEQNDPICATRVFELLQKKLRHSDPRSAFVRTYFARRLSNESDKALEYRRLLKDSPHSPFAFLWASEWGEISTATHSLRADKPLVEKVLSHYLKVLNHRDLHLTGLVATDVAQIRADLLDKLGERERARAAWKEAESMLAKLASELPKGSAARGFTLERISCLASAGELDAALKLSDAYRVRFPSEFTFHFRSAGLLRKLDRIEEALQAAQRAYAVSYGDNKIRTATMLVELFGTKRDKRSAQKIYEEVKQKIRPDTNLEVRTHRYLKNLDEAYVKSSG